MTNIEAITRKFNHVVKHYKSDLDHDLWLVQEFPKHQFLYLLRDTGSHIVFLGKSDFAKTFVDTNNNAAYFIGANTHFYFWNGKSIKKISKEKALEIAANSEIAKIGA